MTEGSRHAGHDKAMIASPSFDEQRFKDVEILAPIADGRAAIATALCTNGIEFWVHCMESNRTFNYGDLHGSASVRPVDRPGEFSHNGDEVVPEDRYAVHAALARVAAGRGEQEFRFRVAGSQGEIRSFRSVGRLAGKSRPVRRDERPRLRHAACECVRPAATGPDRTAVLSRAGVPDSLDPDASFLGKPPVIRAAPVGLLVKPGRQCAATHDRSGLGAR